MFEVKTKIVHDTSGMFGAGDITDRPCPSITNGVNALNSRHFQVFRYFIDTPPPLK